MVDNDTFTYHLKKSLSEPTDTAVRSLITQERTQKLELLIHLLANLTQALIVCGPEGIGKTTLLKVLQERKVESWLYCSIQGNPGLSFEKIQEHMARAITQGKPDRYSQTLTAAFGQYESQKKKIILIIDDAGQLVPGLITTIIHYAASNPVLRVIFVLTHDELHVKSRSDRAIDDCHFVEMPPLSEKQCGEFLQHLSTKPWMQISFNAINEDMVGAVYRETHGIPGKIIAELPALASNPKPSGNGKWILTAAVAGLIAIALSVQWMSSVQHSRDDAAAISSVDPKQSDIEATPLSTALMPPTLTETAQDEQSMQLIQEALQQQKSVNENVSTLSEAEGVLDTSLGLKTVTAPEETGTSPLNHDVDKKRLANDMQQIEAESYSDKNGKSSKLEVAKAADPVKPILSEESNISGNKKNAEVASLAKEKAATMLVTQSSEGQLPVTQPANNYTLQVMVLSKRESVSDVLKKYPTLREEIRYTRKIINGKERYILMYGSFSSSAQASLARNSLPIEFRKAIPVKISTINKEREPAGKNQ